MAEEIVEEYRSSLSDLTFNSKPLISMLTMLAEDNAQYATEIVQVIEAHIQKAKASEKLPAVYLIDSIIKNIPQSNYLQLFSQVIVSLFCGVFEKVDEKTRQAMFKLRQTWSEILPNKKMYALDLRVQMIDPAWPMTATAPETPIASIHVNPKFLLKEEAQETARKEQEEQETLMRQQLLAKQQELLKLQQERLELELAEAKARIDNQTKQFQTQPLQPKGPEQMENKVETAPKPQPAQFQALSGVVNGPPPPSQTPAAPPTIAVQGIRRDPRSTSRDPRLSKVAATQPAPTSTPPLLPEPKSTPALLLTPPDTKLPSSLNVSTSVSGGQETQGDDVIVVKHVTPQKITPSSSSSSQQRRSSSHEKSSSKPKTDNKKSSRSSTRTSSSSSRGKRKASSSGSSLDKRTEKSDKKDKQVGGDKRDKVSTDRRSSERHSTHSSDRGSGRGSTSSRRNYRRETVSSKSPEKSKEKSSRSRSRSPRQSPRSRSPRGSSSEKDKTRRDRRGEEKRRRPADRAGDEPHKKAEDGENHKDRLPEERLPLGDLDSSRDENLDCSGGAPPTKRAKSEIEEQTEENKMPDDFRELFGTEDKDYRKMPPATPTRFPKTPPTPGTPSTDRWAQFKAERPEEFPFAQPRPRIDIPSPGIRMYDVDMRSPPLLLSPLPRESSGGMPHPLPLPRKAISPEQQNIDIPAPLMVEQAEDILQAAKIQLQSGRMTHAQHQDLLKQLAELYKLQKLKKEIQVRRENMADGSDSSLGEESFRSPEVSASERVDPHRTSGVLPRPILPMPPPPIPLSDTDRPRPWPPRGSPPRQGPPPQYPSHGPPRPQPPSGGVEPVPPFVRDGPPAGRSGPYEGPGDGLSPTSHPGYGEGPPEGPPFRPPAVPQGPLTRPEGPPSQVRAEGPPFGPPGNEGSRLHLPVPGSSQGDPEGPPFRPPSSQATSQARLPGPPFRAPGGQPSAPNSRHLGPGEGPRGDLPPERPGLPRLNIGLKLRQPMPAPPPTPYMPEEALSAQYEYPHNVDYHLPYDTDKFYIPEHDPRWVAPLRDETSSDVMHVLNIDDHRYQLPLGGQPRKIPLDGRLTQVCAETGSRAIKIDEICYYKIGDLPRNVIINGKKHNIYYYGPEKKLWIDDTAYEVRIDSPPEKIVIGGKDHFIKIDSIMNQVLIDDRVVCPFGGPKKQIEIGYQKHEVQFEPPPRQILIDNKLCHLNFKGKYPCVTIDSKEHGIRFDGPAREIIINSKPWTVHVDKPRRARFSGGRPHILALGGPGHEVIIDGKWYEVKFNGPERRLRMGNATITVQLKGPPPEVKFMGEVIKDPVKIQELIGDAYIDPSVAVEFRVRVPRPNIRPRLPGPEFGMRQGPRPPRGPAPFDFRPRVPGQMDFRPRGPGPMDFGPRGPGVMERMRGQGAFEHGATEQMRRPPGPGDFGPQGADSRGGPPMERDPRGLGPEDPAFRGPEFGGRGRADQFPEDPRRPGPLRQPQDHRVNALKEYSGGGSPHSPMFDISDSGHSPSQEMDVHSDPETLELGLRGRLQADGPNQGGPKLSSSRSVPSLLDMDIKPPTRFSGPAVGAAPSIRHPHGGPNLIRHPGPFGQDHYGARDMLGPGLRGFRAPMGPDMRMQPGMQPMDQGAFFRQDNFPGQAGPYQDGQFGMGQTQVPFNQPDAEAPQTTQINVNDLFAKLIQSGIIKKNLAESEASVPSEPAQPVVPPAELKQEPVCKPETTVTEQTKEQVEPVKILQKVSPSKLRMEDIPDLTDFNTEKMKGKNRGVVQRMYSGIQCSSCGVRFVTDNMDKYREHLDWHFRQNRRDKEGIKVAKFRRWYYTSTEWIQFEEIGDLEERAHSAYFEKMIQTLQTPGNVSALQPTEAAISCPAASGNENDDVCEMCGEQFEQFWDEDAEEWHLRDAVRFNNKTYHPACYEDARETSFMETPTPASAPVDPMTNPLAYLASLTSLGVSNTDPVPNPTDSQITTEIKSESETEVKTEIKTEVTTEVVTEIVTENKSETDTETKSDDPVTVKQETPESSNTAEVKSEPSS